MTHTYSSPAIERQVRARLMDMIMLKYAKDLAIDLRPIPSHSTSGTRKP